MSQIKIETKTFLEILLPELQANNIFCDGDIEIIEGKGREPNSPYKALKKLDIAGYDYIYFLDSQPYGVSVRIQSKSDKNYRSFTIRKRTDDAGENTEYKKHLKALSGGFDRARYIIQAYMFEGKLLGMAMARKDDVIKYIADSKKVKTITCDNADFYVVKWDDLADAGYKIFEIKKIP